MASWSEIERIRRDVPSAKSMAKSLLVVDRDALTEWEATFLGDLPLKERLDELSTRQAEKLLEIRDDVQRVTTYRGFSIKLVLRACYESRLDLDEWEECWIVDRYSDSEISILRKHAPRLLRMARQLNILDD